jgi:hypothetical protein
VFPADRFFGRITQKGPSKNASGRTNLRHNFGRIFPEIARKGAAYLKCFVFCFFFMKHKKHGIFVLDFGTDMVTKIYSYFDEMKDAIFTKRLNLLPSGYF